MNREDTKKAIKVMQAYVDGADIECQCGSQWTELTGSAEPIFNWSAADYRIKPKPREFEIMVMGNGALREAGDLASGYSGEIIKVREVL